MWTTASWLQAKQLETGAHLEASAAEATVSTLAEYYLEPNMQLLHMFMTVERYQKQPAAAAADLGLTLAQSAELLQRLVQAGILAHNGQAYHAVRDDLHLSPQAAIYPAYRLMTRARAMTRMMTASPATDYNFSVFFPPTLPRVWRSSGSSSVSSKRCRA